MTPTTLHSQIDTLHRVIAQRARQLDIEDQKAEARWPASRKELDRNSANKRRRILSPLFAELNTLKAQLP
jgi:hypothetical protein